MNLYEHQVILYNKLIIVNDASTDGTQEQVQRFLSDTRIRYIFLRPECRSQQGEKYRLRGSEGKLCHLF